VLSQSIIKIQKSTTNLLRVGSNGALLNGSSSGLDVGGSNSTGVCVFAVSLRKLEGTRNEGLSSRNLLNNERVRAREGRRQSQRRRNKK